MLVRNIQIGSSAHMDNYWERELQYVMPTGGKKFKSHSLVNKVLGQRIQLDNAIGDYDEGTNTSIYDLGNDVTVQYLDFKNCTENFDILVNYNNFTTRIKKSDDDKSTEMWSLTLDSFAYRLVAYTYNEKVVGTYRKKDKYQGCMIMVPVTKYKAEAQIISCVVKNVFTNQFIKYVVSYLPETDSISVRVVPVKTRKSIEKLSSADTKHGEHGLTFKVNMKTDIPATKTIVILESFYDKFVSKLTEMAGKDVTSRYNIIRLNDSLFDGKFAKPEVAGLLKPDLTENKVRAVTFIGFKLPAKVTNELRLSYIFGFDVETGEIFNIKS